MERQQNRYVEKVLVIADTYENATALRITRPELPQPLYGHVHIFPQSEITMSEVKNALAQTRAGAEQADHIIVIGCVLSGNAHRYLFQNGITYEVKGDL